MLAVIISEGPLDVYGAVQGPGYAREGGHEAVAHVLDCLAAVTSDALPEDTIVLLQDPVRTLVSESAGERGPPFDIREQECDRTFEGG